MKNGAFRTGRPDQAPEAEHEAVEQDYPIARRLRCFWISPTPWAYRSRCLRSRLTPDSSSGAVETLGDRTASTAPQQQVQGRIFEFQPVRDHGAELQFHLSLRPFLCDLSALSLGSRATTRPSRPAVLAAVRPLPGPGSFCAPRRRAYKLQTSIRAPALGGGALASPSRDSRARVGLEPLGAMNPFSPIG